jgi:VCBS repeat-containing protein
VVAAYQVATHTFGWTDISTQGTALSLGDDASALASLGFTFNYLGGSYSQVNVNSNGNLTFGGAHTAYTNESLATASITNIVAFFWDDLNPSGGGQVRVATLGSAGSRRFIVSFNGIKHYSTSGTGSFQAVLFEADSSIEFHYQDVNFGSTSYNGGKSATIGVKGGPVTQWSYNTTSVSDNSALRFTLPAPANAAPQAANDGYATGEDEVLTIGPDGVLANDTDADGDPLTAALVSGPSHGTLTLDTDGSFTYAPAANYNGPDSFAYRANDGTTSSNQATVSINVNAVNDAPTVVSDGYAVLEGQTLTVTAPGVLGNDADVDGDSLSASLDVGPQNGTLSLDADGSFTYTPNAGYYGYDSFSYDANDGNGGAATGLVTIYVRSNAVPVAYGDSYSTNEDAGLAVSAPGVLGNDTDGDQDPLTAALVSQPSNGTVSLSANGSFVYTPNANFHGSDSFSYTASDGLAASNEATVTINVGSVNDAPAATNDAYAVDEDGSLAVAGPGILGNDGDVDGDALTAVLVSGPTKGTLSLDGDGSFTYVPNANANGADSFTYRANDGVATSNLATVSITVNPTNDAPTAANDAYTANQGTTLNVAAP